MNNPASGARVLPKPGQRHEVLQKIIACMDDRGAENPGALALVFWAFRFKADYVA